MMDIGEVSQQTGLKASTLRYYEEKGLIKSNGRKGLRRQYAPIVIEQISLILLAKHAGFSLEETKALISEPHFLDRALMQQKADELAHKISELTAIHNMLTHAVNCPEENQLDCERFQTLMKLALKRTKST